jgi:hypothetical protein
MVPSMRPRLARFDEIAGRGDENHALGGPVVVDDSLGFLDPIESLRVS